MPITKEQVLERLAQIAGPDGTPLPETGALSDIVANDGKVFFSINVDATAVQAWEPVRKRAETGSVQCDQRHQFPALISVTEAEGNGLKHNSGNQRVGKRRKLTL